MSKPTIKIDRERAELLSKEIGKVRAWITGFEAGRYGVAQHLPIPGVDSLRQIQILIKEACNK